MKESLLRNKSCMFQGTVNGVPAWSNDFIMEIGVDNPFRRLREVDWQKRLDLQTIYDRYNEALPGAEIVILTKEEDELVYLTTQARSYYIQKPYYDYFRQRYPKAEFLVSVGVIFVHSNNLVVGLIMPYYKKEEK